MYSNTSVCTVQGSHKDWKTGKTGNKKVVREKSGKSQGTLFLSKSQGKVRELFFKMPKSQGKVRKIIKNIEYPKLVGIDCSEFILGATRDYLWNNFLPERMLLIRNNSQGNYDTGQGKVREKSGNFFPQNLWEPWYCFVLFGMFWCMLNNHFTFIVDTLNDEWLYNINIPKNIVHLL